MAKCSVCGKSVSFGNKISHSHRRSNKIWKPNLRRVRAIVKGVHKRIYVCTRCLRSGMVERGYGNGLLKAVEVESPQIDNIVLVEPEEAKTE